MEMKKIGEWSFIAGVLLAIVAGLAATLLPMSIVAIVLVIFGVLVGLLNIGAKETTNFLVAAIAILLTGAAGLQNLPTIGTYLAPVLSNIAAFVAPAALIVALKTIYELGRKV